MTLLNSVPKNKQVTCLSLFHFKSRDYCFLPLPLSFFICQLLVSTFDKNYSRTSKPRSTLLEDMKDGNSVSAATL